MKDSHDESYEAHTHPNQDVELQTQDYSAKFEKNYKVFQLSSELNEANIQIQKLSIKIQKDKRKYKNTIECILRQKDDMTQKYETLTAEFQKIKTMLQAQKQARKIVNGSNKKLQDQFIMIAQKLDVKQLKYQTIIEKIQQLQNNQSNYKMRIKTLSIEMENLTADKNQQERILKDNKQRQIKRIKQQFERKICYLQHQMAQQKMTNYKSQVIAKKLSELSNKYDKMRQKLEEKQSELSQKSRQLERIKNDNILKEEEIKNLRLKSDLWLLSREKSRDQKLKFDQRIEQVQFQINLAEKQKGFHEQRYEQQTKKAFRFEKMVQQKNQQLRKRQQQYIKFEQQCQKVKKKLQSYETYKQKYDKSQFKIKQLQQKIMNSMKFEQKHSQKFHILQKSLQKSQNDKCLLNDQITILKRSIQQRQMSLKASSLTINNLSQKQQKMINQITNLKTENNELTKKIAYFQVQTQSHKQSVHQLVCGDDLINKVRNEVALHYGKLLDDEMQNRKGLQQLIYQTKANNIELKNELSQRKHQLAQIKQQKQLIYLQNQRLLHIQAENQNNQQKIIIQIQDRSIQLKTSRRQISLKKIAKLNIQFCFSYMLNGENRSNYTERSGFRTNYMQIYTNNIENQRVDSPRSFSKIFQVKQNGEFVYNKQFKN